MTLVELEAELRQRFGRAASVRMLDYCRRYRIVPERVVGISYGKIGATVTMSNGAVYSLHYREASPR